MENIYVKYILWSVGLIGRLDNWWSVSGLLSLREVLREDC